MDCAFTASLEPRSHHTPDTHDIHVTQHEGHMVHRSDGAVVALAASNAAASTSRGANSAAKTSEETISHSEQRAVEEPSRTAAIRDPDAPQGRWFGWFGWGHKYPYYQTYHYPSYNYYNSYYCKPKPYYYGGSYNNNYNNNYNSYAYRSAGGDTDDEIKPRQATPRDQLGVRAMQRQTVAAKRQIASTCAEWLSVSLDEISSAPDEVKVQDDACCYPSGCALAPSAGCIAKDGQPCCVPDSERREVC